MDQPFVLEHGPHQRFSLYPPVDPYGDGYIAHLRAQVFDQGLCAETTATIGGRCWPAYGRKAGGSIGVQEARLFGLRDDGSPAVPLGR